MSNEEIWKRGLDLTYVIDAYRNLNMDDHFFRSFFELLMGTDTIRKMIKQGKSADEIKATWKQTAGQGSAYPRRYVSQPTSAALPRRCPGSPAAS